MYHCDACGWDGETPATADEPFGDALVWTMRVCPECGDEVYETPVVKVPICSCGDVLGHSGPCQSMFF